VKYSAFSSFNALILLGVNSSGIRRVIKSGSNYTRVPTPPGKSWIFSANFQDLESPGKSLWSWRVLEIKAWVLESRGKISLRVVHFSGGSNDRM